MTAAPDITPAQCHAARALLLWSHHDLAERSAIDAPSLCRFEGTQEEEAFARDHIK